MYSEGVSKDNLCGPCKIKFFTKKKPTNHEVEEETKDSLRPIRNQIMDPEIYVHQILIDAMLSLDLLIPSYLQWRWETSFILSWSSYHTRAHGVWIRKKDFFSALNDIALTHESRKQSPWKFLASKRLGEGGADMGIHFVRSCRGLNLHLIFLPTLPRTSPM